jgi:hypothetical protein
MQKMTPFECGATRPRESDFMRCGSTTPELSSIKIDGIVRPIEEFINLTHVNPTEIAARV